MEVRTMKNLFFFNKMLTPKIITIVYWLLLVAAVLSGLDMMFNEYDGLTVMSFFMGLAVSIGSMIGARIWCELLIVLFKIHENLQSIAEKAEK
jgi:hypothetical protein